MAVIATELKYEFWVDTPRGRELRTFNDIERARSFRERHPDAGSGTTIVTQELETPIGATENSYQRPGLHTEP